MLRNFSKGIPVLLFTVLLFVFIYIATGLIIFGDLNGVIDWGQIHTAPLGTMILLISLLSWGAVLFILDKKGWIQPLYMSEIYRILSSLLLCLYVGAISAFLFIAYHLSIEELGKTTEWIQQYPERFSFTVFLLALITFGLILIIGEAYMASGLALIVFYLVSVANYYKKEFRNEPLFPYDFVQIGQLGEVIPMISGAFSLPIVFAIFLSIVGAVFLWWKLPKITIGWITRLVLLVPIVYLVYSFFLYDDRFTASYYEEYASIMPWNQQNNYYYNGPVIGMISNLKIDVVRKPDSYNEAAVKESLEQAKETSQEYTGEGEEEKPNIVFYVNETFWDPTHLDLTFSEDPMPNIRSLMEENPAGTFFSPAFGGETANVEFETLTSFSMNYINPGGNPFNNLLSNKSYPSFVSYLNDRDYHTEAMHPNSGNLYRRYNVYPNLGFDTSKFIEDMTYTEKDNKQFVSDESVAKELLDTLKNEEDPAFVHAVTIANHLPYDADKYEGGSTISVEGEGLSQDSKTRIETYSEGIKRSDETLQWLYEEIQKLDEPTILVFYGDHLPSIGANLRAFKETGYGDEEDQQTNPKFYETPLLFLSNYDTGVEKDLGTMSPIYLAPYISKELGFETPPFYDFMLEMKEEIPAFRKRIYMTGENEVVDSTEKLPSSTQEILQDYHHFQYDVFTGKQHVIDQLYNKE